MGFAGGEETKEEDQKEAARCYPVRQQQHSVLWRIAWGLMACDR